MNLITLLERGPLPKSKEKIDIPIKNPVLRFLHTLASLTGELPVRIISAVFLKSLYKTEIDHDKTEKVKDRLLPIIRKYNSMVKERVQVRGIGVIRSSSILLEGNPNMENAFAFPGGYIFITPRILELDDTNKGLLEFIICHELGHLSLHSAQMEKTINILIWMPLMIQVAKEVINIYTTYKGLSADEQDKVQQFIDMLSSIGKQKISEFSLSEFLVKTISFMGWGFLLSLFKGIISQKHEYMADELSARLIASVYGGARLGAAVKWFLDLDFYRSKKKFTIADFIGRILDPVPEHPTFQSRVMKIKSIQSEYKEAHYAY